MAELLHLILGVQAGEKPFQINEKAQSVGEKSF